VANYNRVKTTNTAPVGTVMPWCGSSASSTLKDSIPKGWMVCDGRQLKAADYPLLALTIGNTYGPYQEVGGGSVGIINSYPNYDTDGQRTGYTDIFYLPNFSQRALVDIEASLLDPVESTVIGAYLSENGVGASPPTFSTSYIDIAFQTEQSNNLAGRLTGVSIGNPSYLDTFYTIPRKLGVDHTPSHTHGRNSAAGIEYNSVSIGAGYTRVFEAGNSTYQSSWTSATALGNNGANSTPDSYSSPLTPLTFYDEDASSLVETSSFKTFAPTATQIPLTTSRTIAAYANTAPNTSSYNDSGSRIVETAQEGVTGSIPVAGTYQSLRNYYSSTPTQTYATTLQHNQESYNSAGMSSHNHATIDLEMNKGGLGLSSTILYNNVGTGSVTPINVDRAINISINANTPSQTITYIIKVY
jgi:hypothetical protein